MQLYIHRAFVLLSIPLISISFIYSRNPKLAEPTIPEQADKHWQEYGNTWSEWAENWKSGWSKDDKHATITTEHPTSQSSEKKNKLIENDCVKLFGAKTMTGKRIKKNLTIYGTGTLVNVSVGAVLTNYGKLDASHSVFHEFDSYGTTQLKNCTISKEAVVCGLLETEGCIFKSGLTVWSKHTKLSNTKVLGDVSIKYDKGQKKQTLELTNTIIEGSVRFEGNKGTVILKGTSSVKGDIVGGTVVLAEIEETAQ